MKIISISGLDGSGKSTQAKMLQDFFERKGKKVVYFHAVQYSLPQQLKQLQNKLLQKESKPGTDKSVASANWLQINLRKLAFVIDVVRFHFFKKRLAKNGCDFLITDRYFYDSIVNIAYLQKRKTPPRIERLLPHADKAFYLKIEPEAIMKRNRIPEQGMQYLKDKKKLYDMYVILWNQQTIDGNKNKEDIQEEIKTAIGIN